MRSNIIRNILRLGYISVISLHLMYCFNTKLARAASNKNLFEYDNAKNTLDFTAKLIDDGDEYEELYVEV